MSKKLELLLPITILLALILIACQKQDITKPTQKTTTTNITLARADAKDYSIPLEKAALFAKSYRDNKPEQAPIGYRVPLQGLLQLIKRVQDNDVEVSHITFYLAKNDEGKPTLIYVATKEDGTDLLQYPKEGETQNGPPRSPVYDFVGELTNGTVSNILNTN